MTASSTSCHRTDDTPCRVEAGASLARATRSTIHLARSVHPAYLMALRPQLRFARSSASRTARSIPRRADRSRSTRDRLHTDPVTRTPSLASDLATPSGHRQPRERRGRQMHAPAGRHEGSRRMMQEIRYLPAAVPVAQSRIPRVVGGLDPTTRDPVGPRCRSRPGRQSQ